MTETARVHAQSVYDGLRTAFRRLVKAVGGVEAGAGMTRVSKTTLATYYDRNSVPQAWAPMDVIIDLEDAAGEPLVTRELARALGYELVPSVDEPRSAGMVDLLRIVAEDSDAGGRFAATVLQVTRDGRLDPHEIDALVQRAGRPRPLLGSRPRRPVPRADGGQGAASGAEGGGMKCLSVCSGIGAPEVAWSRLGWRFVAGAEIEAFPNAVRARHFPNVPNWGDMTKFGEWPDADVDLLVGGTPCQSFSVAGLRGGLADPRGNLALTYLAIADRYHPRWIVWENVPGVLSSSGGRDFGAFLGGLGQCGYGWAYRVLDAQYFGVPQRRRRVFVVGYLGDWRPAAAVLFERESLSGHPPPRREAWEGVARCLAHGSGSGQRYDGETETFVPVTANTLGAKKGGGWRGDLDNDTYVAHSLRADGFDASEDGTGRGTPLVPVPILEAGARTGKSTDDTRAGSGIGAPGDPMFSLQASKQHAVAFDMRGREGGAMPEGPHDTANIRAASGGSSRSYIAFHARQDPDSGPTTHPLDTDGYSIGVSTATAVRRLTPRECERLQGFPDDYTLVPYRGKPAADGPRYRALGNSMAVPVMAWLGKRIDQVEQMLGRKAAA